MTNTVSLENFGATIKSTTLKNGIKLVSAYKPKSPVYIVISLLAGSRFDHAGKEGLSHLLEHLLVSGTKKFPKKEDLARKIDSVGGLFGATTGVESLFLWASFPDSGDFRVVLEVLSEELLNSTFAPNSFSKERDAILAEIGRKNSNPVGLLSEISKKLVFQGTRLEYSTLGTPESLRGISIDDVVDQYKNVLKTSGILVFVSGDITHANALESAEKCFGKISKEKIAALNSALPIIRKETITTNNSLKTDHISISLDFRAQNFFGELFSASRVLATILGRGKASRLAIRLRQEAGLVYEFNVGSLGFEDSGVFSIRTSTAKNSLEKVLKIIAGELQNISKSKIDEREVKMAKVKMVKSLRLSLETSEAFANFHTYPNLIAKSRWTVEDYIKGINAVTPDDILKYAKKYLNRNSWYLSAVGNITNEELIDIASRVWKTRIYHTNPPKTIDFDVLKP
ncbi:insulinase family protein [Patescibacteria group bacterium]|nr:insulinase family protein [Patescibacteria group bacterium]